MPYLKGDFMEIINISKSELNSLKPLEFSDDFLNVESPIYIFNYCGTNMILKKISDSDGIILLNKLDTIQTINELSSYLPENFVIPKFLVSVDKRIEAFVEPFIKGETLNIILKDINISNEEKKYYLKRIGLILEQMKNIRNSSEKLRNFYLGDLHEDNFIVERDQRQIYVIDLDSAKISSDYFLNAKYLSHVTLMNYVNGKYNVNIHNHFFTNYIVDENTDLYCYIIIILNFLYGENINNMNINDFYRYLNYLNELNLDKNLLDCFSRIVSKNCNINPVEYVESLTSKQIYMAKRKVFEKKDY